MQVFLNQRKLVPTKIKESIVTHFHSQFYCRSLSTIFQYKIIVNTFENRTFLIFVSPPGISELKEKLYDLATRVPDPNNRPNKLLGRSIPKSYLHLETAMQESLKNKLDEKRQPFLEHDEFLEIINKVPNNDLDSAEEIRQGGFTLEIMIYVYRK